MLSVDCHRSYFGQWKDVCLSINCLVVSLVCESWARVKYPTIGLGWVGLGLIWVRKVIAGCGLCGLWVDSGVIVGRLIDD